MSNTYLEYSEDIDGRGKTYVLHIDRADLGAAVFTDFDRALFADIDGDNQATIADRLLGLETIVRRIEEAEAKPEEDSK